MLKRQIRPLRGLVMGAVVLSFGLAATPTSTTVPDPTPIPDSRDFARTEALANWWLRGAGALSAFHAVGAPAPVAVAASRVAPAAEIAPSEYRLFTSRSERGRRLEPRRLSVPFAMEITTAARRHRLDDRLVAAIVQVESSFDPRVVSPRGAIGLMQVMPDLASESALDPFDPRMNLELGSRYFSRLLRRYEGDVHLALAAYNAGPGAVDRFGGMPPYRETNQFVKRVLQAYDLHQVEAAVAVDAVPAPAAPAEIVGG
jgi:soluble lytic murein transglycosylase-like protein